MPFQTDASERRPYQWIHGQLTVFEVGTAVPSRPFCAG